MQHKQHRKKVVIAGAGPGDPGLITLKAVHYLQLADVVLIDRLVNEDIINKHVTPGTKIIYVGKEGYNTSSTPQSLINELLVEHALQDKLVVRLKGGDVSFFSNMLDELNILTRHNIPFEIIPGITAASGAAAFAGFPLTARGYASAVRFLAYNNTAALENINWSDLAQTNDTLVFYMSSQNLDGLIDQLLKFSIAGTKMLAVIEQATTPFQQVHTYRIEEYSKKPGNKNFTSPTIVIIGKVVELHDSFRWFLNHNDDGVILNRKENRYKENFFIEIK